MDPRGLMVTQTAYFSLLNAKPLPLVILCDTAAGIEKNGMEVRTEGQKDMKSEFVI